MSKVTNVIITTGLGEDASGVVEKLKQFTYGGKAFLIVSIKDKSLPDGWYGGGKYLECNMFIGAYNFLDIEALMTFMKEEMTWEDPEDVQVIYKEQEDDKFRIVDLFR